MTDKSFKIIVFSAIVLAVFGLYWPSLQNGFVFDDEQIVINNSQVASLKNISKAFTSCIWEPHLETCYERSNYYRPLHTLSIMFTHAVSDKPFVFHLVNIAYYIVFCWLAFVLLSRLFKDRLAAVLGTLVFLFNPLHAESVMWISGLPELLMGIFAISAFLVHDSGRHYWLSGFLFFFALLSKETAIALIPVLIVYERLFKDKKIIWKSYAWYAAFFAIYLAMRVPAIGFSKKIPFDFGVSFSDKISAAVSAFAIYFKKIFLSSPLSPVVPVEPGVAVNFFIGLVLILFFAFAIKHSLKSKKKFWGLGIAVFFFFLAPPLVGMFSAFTKGDFVVADRYLSFPLLGIAIIFGHYGSVVYERLTKLVQLTKLSILTGFMKLVRWRFLIKLVASVKAVQVALPVLFLALLAFWGWQTFAQNEVWQSSRSLYEHIHKTNEARGFISDKTTLNLAVIYGEEGGTAEANNLYAKIISRAGDFPLSASQAANKLGIFYAEQGDLNNAEFFFRSAWEIFPYNSSARKNLDLLQNGVK